MKKSMVLTGALAALALGVLAPTTASAAPAVMDGDWTFTGQTWPNSIMGDAACKLEAFYLQRGTGRDYDCHWAVPLKMDVIGLWYK